MAESAQSLSHGLRPRTLYIRVGQLVLHVPQVRNGSFSTELFCRYQRSEQAYPFVIVDALVIKVRRDEAVRLTGGLIVSGVNETGYRELPGLRLGDSESEGI